MMREQQAPFISNRIMRIWLFLPMVGMLLGLLWALPVLAEENTAVYVFGRPQLSIQSAVTNPTVPLPGEPFELTMAIGNFGNWTAIDIELELKSTDIVIPASGSNVRIIPRIGVDETITVTISLNLSQNALEGPQNLNFNIDYFDISEGSCNTQQSVGLAISNVIATPTPGPEQPRLVLTTYSPDMDLENNTIYVGPLDGGTSGSLDALAFPTTSGTLDVIVSVNYLDDFNQPQIYEETLTVEIEAPFVPEEFEAGSDGGPSQPQDDDGEETFMDKVWRFVKGMLGLGS